MIDMTSSRLDLLVVAPHPDDAEIFCGGTLAAMAARGYACGIADLSAGELGTRGTVDTRAKESAAATAILGLRVRENLGLPDGGINPHDQKQIERLVGVLRCFSPKVVIVPDVKDRHPDHTAAHELCMRAIFFAGLKKYMPAAGETYRPTQVLLYQQRQESSPSFAVDVSAVYDKKRAAVKAYGSQVGLTNTNEGSTLLASPLSLSSLEARDAYVGAMIGVAYAEAFASPTLLSISDPIQHFKDNPTNAALYFPKRN